MRRDRVTERWGHDRRGLGVELPLLELNLFPRLLGYRGEVSVSSMLERWQWLVSLTLSRGTWALIKGGGRSGYIDFGATAKKGAPC